MNIVYKIFGSVLLTLLVSQLQAYTFTFRNHTAVPVKVEMQLVGFWEPYHAITVEPGKENFFNFDGIRVGFCMYSNTLKLTPHNGKTIEAPVFWANQKVMYDQIMDEVKKSGKSTVVLGRGSNKFPSLCENAVFDIVTVIDHETQQEMVRAMILKPYLW